MCGFDGTNKDFGILYHFMVETSMYIPVEKYRKILKENKDKKPYLLLTMVNWQLRYWKTYLEEDKWVEIYKFNNPNTDNDVHIYMRTN